MNVHIIFVQPTDLFIHSFSLAYIIHVYALELVKEGLRTISNPLLRTVESLFIIETQVSMALLHSQGLKRVG